MTKKTTKKATKAPAPKMDAYHTTARAIMKLADVGYPEKDKHGNTSNGLDDMLDTLYEGSIQVNRKHIVGNVWADITTGEEERFVGTLLPREVHDLDLEVSTNALRDDVLRKRWADDTARRVSSAVEETLDAVWWLCENAREDFGTSPALNWLAGCVEDLKKAFGGLGPYDPADESAKTRSTCGVEFASDIQHEAPRVDTRKVGDGKWTLEVVELKGLLPDGGLPFEAAEVFWDLLADIGMVTDPDTTTIVTRGTLLEGLEHKARHFGEYDKVERSVVKPLIEELKKVPSHYFIAINSVDKTEEN